MRQIRHIVPGIYHREIKNTNNYVRRTNGNKNRSSSVRTTYSSGGLSTSVPNNKEDKPIEIEDSKDDFIFTIDSSNLVNWEFKIHVYSHLDTTGNVVGLNKPYYIDWGDGKIEKFVVVNTEDSTVENIQKTIQKTHIYKEKRKYQIKVHHKDIPLSIAYMISSSIENRIDIPDSIISIEQWGLCSEFIPHFTVIDADGIDLYSSHGMMNLQSFPPLPYPYIEPDKAYVMFVSPSPILSGNELRSLPNEFLKNVALSVKEHPNLYYNLNYMFGFSKIETLPEDLFKPFSDFSVGKQASFEKMFAYCPIKDRFPFKNQPLDWKTEEGQKQWRGIFAGCKTIPNYDEIPPILRGE